MCPSLYRIKDFPNSDRLNMVTSLEDHFKQLKNKNNPAQNNNEEISGAHSVDLIQKNLS